MGENLLQLTITQNCCYHLLSLKSSERNLHSQLALLRVEDVPSPQDCDSNIQTQCHSHLQTADKKPDPAAFQLSIQQFRKRPT